MCDLDQMAENVNPDWLKNCTRDPECTQMTCQAGRELANFFSTVTFTDMSCLTLPGVRMVFFRGDGSVGTDVLITEPRVVTTTNHVIAGQLTVVVFAQSTPGRSIDITVRNEISAPQHAGNTDIMLIILLLCRLIQ